MHGVDIHERVLPELRNTERVQCLQCSIAHLRNKDDSFRDRILTCDDK